MTVLTETTTLGEHAINIAELHNANRGATYSLVEGDLTGRNAWAVGVCPECGRIYGGGPRLLVSAVKAFLQRNRDVLANGHAVGTWADGQCHYLDIVRLVGDLTEALALGRANGQRAIYHLGTGETVYTAETA